MAGKKGGKQAKQDWMVDFAAVKLRAEDKEAFEAYRLELDKHDVDPLLELLADGWKISHNLDAENDCFIVSATQKGDNHRNKGICVVSRSDNPYEAVLMNFYKINVMYKGERLPTENTSDNWG